MQKCRSIEGIGFVILTMSHPWKRLAGTSPTIEQISHLCQIEPETFRNLCGRSLAKSGALPVGVLIGQTVCTTSENAKSTQLSCSPAVRLQISLDTEVRLLQAIAFNPQIQFAKNSDLYDLLCDHCWPKFFKARRIRLCEGSKIGFPPSVRSAKWDIPWNFRFVHCYTCRQGG